MTISEAVFKSFIAFLSPCVRFCCCGSRVLLSVLETSALTSSWSPDNLLNLSQRNLTSDEISLLRKGLNYAITPRSVPNKEFLASVEEGISKLSQRDQDEVRAEVSSTLRRARLPQQQNLTQGERKAMKDLKTASDIVIVQADKGNATVVMDRTAYNAEVREMLQDQNVYKKNHGQAT